MLGPSLRSSFGIIDDHEILDIIGRHPRLPVSEILPTIAERTNEPVGRFRPAYWLGRTLEAAAAGQNSTWWYVDRFVLAAIALVAIYVALCHVAPPPVAAVVALLPFTGRQFETWTRLGPSEAYAFPLLCLAVLFIVRATVRGDPPARMWPAYVLLAAAALAKENFLFVGPVVVVGIVLLHGVRRMSRRDWTAVAAVAAVAALNLVLILAKAAQHGTVYPQERTTASARAWYAYALEPLRGSARLYVGVILMIALFAVVKINRLQARRIVLWLSVAGAAVLLQIAFYAGAPQVGRYLYPVVLIAVIIWGVVAQLGRSATTRLGVIALHTLIIVLLLPPVLQGMKESRDLSLVSASSNNAFAHSLAEIERTAINSGATVVVLQPADPRSDQERVLSLARFLYAGTDLQVMTLPPSQVADDPFSQSLAATMVTWSRQGYQRLVPYRPTAGCLSVIFGEDEPVCPLAVSPPG